MIIKFFLRYYPINETTEEKDLVKCIKNYLSTNFIWDLVCIVPIQKFEMHNARQNLIYMLKQIRLMELSESLDVRRLSKVIGQELFKFREWVLQKPPEKMKIFKFQYNVEEVYNFKESKKIMKFEKFSKNDINLIVAFVVELCTNIYVIFQVAYQVSMLFLIMCVIIEDFMDDTNYKLDNLKYSQMQNRFLIEYQLYDMTNRDVVLRLLYFAFTTLTTIGFGDFHPKGDIERAYTAVMLLMGVMTMTYVMGNMIALLQQFNEYIGDYDEGMKLNVFLETLKRFNDCKPLCPIFKASIETYFDHRWQHNFNQPFELESDMQIYDECPIDIKQQILVFLFENYLHNYRYYFCLRNFKF